MRQVALVLVTTGLNATDRVIEIAAVEMLEGVATGNAFNVRINPPKNITLDATNLHHFTNADVERHESFKSVADKFLAFIVDSEVLVYSAPFLKPLLNNELELAGKPRLDEVCAKMTDVWAMAKKVYPGASNSLDDVALRHHLIREKRKDRIGMRDANLLAEVYGALKKTALEKEINLDAAPKKRKQPGMFSQSVVPAAASAAQPSARANHRSRV